LHGEGFFHLIHLRGCRLEIRLSGIVVIVGNYGSGKTEVSINLAVHRKRAGLGVRIADLDLVNPYFRTREARMALRKQGVDVVLPAEKYLQADLPVLNPAIAGMIREPGDLTILDVGGDDAGATVLAALADAFMNRPVSMLQVINPLRPATRTVEGCLKIRREIEAAAQMKITGVIGNANLMDETCAEDIYSGYEFVNSFAVESILPLEFITVAAEFMAQIDTQRFVCPVLPIFRQLVPPWLKARKFEE
jgi:hypothetical protein